jgi:peptidyl-dipeptidase Dcp
MSPNPFFETWTTPFGVPPFDRIRAGHFPEALDRGMQQQITEIEAIARNPAAPDFANTLEALERSGALLAKVANVFDNLVASLGTPELEAIDLEFAPRRAQHGMRVALNQELFTRIEALYANRASLGLAPDALRLLERRHLGFIRSGARLGPAEKSRMSEISERLATLHTQFGQNVVHDEKAWHLALTEADLAGLPEFVRQGARQAAEERGLAGYAITLGRSSIEPFLTFSTRRDLRQTAWLAWVARGEHAGPHDNRMLIPEILALRLERARLLGYATYADFRMADTMAGSQQAVARLTDEVWAAAKHRAAAERDRLQLVARTDGINDPIAPWDWRHYAERVRQEEYAIDEAELKPYFVLENIQQAAFDTAHRLFGLQFVERPDIPAYHPDMRAWEVRDKDGHVGVFIADNYARAGKRSGAWMSGFRDQQALDEPIAPIIANNNNFSRGTPTLLSYDDAETLFHEFGHALHGLLSRVRYPSQSGTSVRRDFVEFPSQIYEHWLAVPQTLRRYARHHETNEPIPEPLLQRMLSTRTFNQGFATIEYTASAVLDMAMHDHPDPAGMDVAAFEREVLDKIGMPPEIGPRHRPTHFQHLFAGSGYAAGYYSYLWAEVLDADGFGCFEAAGDPFDPVVAARLRHILQSGDTIDPMELYVAFRGEQPRTDALLRHRGLVAMAAT